MECLNMLFAREKFRAPVPSKGTALLVFDQMPHLDVVWDDELLHEQKEAGFDECLVADKKGIIALVITDLIPHDSDMDTADKLFNNMPPESTDGLADKPWLKVLLADLL